MNGAGPEKQLTTQVPGGADAVAGQRDLVPADGVVSMYEFPLNHPFRDCQPARFRHRHQLLQLGGAQGSGIEVLQSVLDAPISRRGENLHDFLVAHASLIEVEEESYLVVHGKPWLLLLQG